MGHLSAVFCFEVALLLWGRTPGVYLEESHFWLQELQTSRTLSRYEFVKNLLTNEILFVFNAKRWYIAQWGNKCISLSVLSLARVQFSVIVESCKRFFPIWPHSANSEKLPSWHAQPVDIEEEGLHPTMHRQWLKEIDYKLTVCVHFDIKSSTDRNLSWVHHHASINLWQLNLQVNPKGFIKTVR